MVSEKRAILVETPAVLVGGRQIRETFEEPRDPLSTLFISPNISIVEFY